MSKHNQDLIGQLQSQVAELTQALDQTNLQLQQTIVERDRANLLFEINTALNNANLDIDAITTIVVNVTERIGATLGEVYLITDAGQLYFKSSNSDRNNLDTEQQEKLLLQAVSDGPAPHALDHNQILIISDVLQEYPDALEFLDTQLRSLICAPLVVDPDWPGVVIFGHHTPHFFTEHHTSLLTAITPQIVTALEKATHIDEIKSSLHETHLMLDISRQLARADNLADIYAALAHAAISIGASRCTIYTCDELGKDNLPIYGQIIFSSDANESRQLAEQFDRFRIANYPILHHLVKSQEPVVIESISGSRQLTNLEKELFTAFKAQSAVITPLVTRSTVIGLLSVEYQYYHAFSERELDLYRTLCNQTTIAIENTRQKQRTQDALAETQTLYRAGRVLAGAADLQEILEKSLVEFVYSLGLDQGGVTLVSSDRKTGKLMAYLQNGQLQNIEKLKFNIDETTPYQAVLLAGRPFISFDVPNDDRIAQFVTFNQQSSIKSILQAPMIIRGETIGWIGADAVKTHREFSQREVDLARAMADQIAITIQNRRLLEQTELRADRLKAVATVGEAVTGLTELDEVLDQTVNLIRDRFGFYHVSIFLMDEAREWAVVRASTGEVGQIMVESPHRLAIGGNSIVGFCTHHAEPRIALDVGEDAVHFENPLLPNTRSEMALPLILRGIVIGALDVQSQEPNAFSDEDVETLQIMANQVTAAISNSRLFEQIQHRLSEQQHLYEIGAQLGGTLNIHEAAAILTTKTAQFLDVAECVVSLLEEKDTVYVISDHVDESSKFRVDEGNRYKIADFASWNKILVTKRPLTMYTDTDETDNWEVAYLKAHEGTALAMVPILLRNEVIGLLEVYDHTPKRRFKQTEISLLESIALQAANSIENAKLFGQANESQAFLTAVIDQIPDPIFIKDRDHRFVTVNTAFAQDLLNRAVEQVIGLNDYDFLSEAEAKKSLAMDNIVFETGEIQEIEETRIDAHDQLQVLYTRKIPLTLTDNPDKPEYLVGIINDITQIRQREVERDRLIEETRRTLDRTQTLYRISDNLAISTEIRSTFEAVLSEYLNLLGLKQGSIMLFDKATNCNKAQARVVNGRVIPPNLVIPVDEDQVFQHLKKNQKPLILEDAQSHPLVSHTLDERAHKNIKTMLFIPLVIRQQLMGSLVVDVVGETYSFDPSDVDTGEAIADQLTIWLENRRLLTEAQYRSDRLQTAAEISRAASQILDIDDLITTSVNLIRDQFDFYYVGLFLVDEAKEWAVLHAGTGKAGEIQLAKNHRLKIGGESMIGWSIHQRKARIALNVGEEAIHFQNPDLPNTQSEMALPLISRDDVIGALTVQSVEQRAFSVEDITLLQTMADQLANAFSNAHLFERVEHSKMEAENRLRETQALQQLSQALSGTLKIDDVAGAFFESCTQLLNFDYVVISLIDEARRQIKAVAGLNITNEHINRTVYSLDSATMLADVIRRSKTETIFGWDNRLDRVIFEAAHQVNWGARVFMPIILRQRAIGVIEAGFKQKRLMQVPEDQIKLLQTFIDQTALALESAQRYEATQKAAQREKIIREVTEKIQNAVTVEDILKTTVLELSKIVGATQAGINLGTTLPQPSLPSDINLNRDARTRRGDNPSSKPPTKPVSNEESQQS
ncbi:MAG: GAF domain-containing protein [Anaerolineae bacterium]|nr:GAF domain-containing protein [Anaerolineae bacterium]